MYPVKVNKCPRCGRVPDRFLNITGTCNAEYIIQCPHCGNMQEGSGTFHFDDEFEIVYDGDFIAKVNEAWNNGV